MSPENYVKNVIKVVEAMLTEDGDKMKLKSTAKNPFPSNYRPELDITTEIGDEMATRFMQLVGNLRWAVELGCLIVFILNFRTIVTTPKLHIISYLPIC
jgi:hypothetical protein